MAGRRAVDCLESSRTRRRRQLTGETIWKSPSPPGEGSTAGGSPAGPNRPERTNGPGGRDRNADTAIAGTKDPGLYTSEHWGMRSFSCKLPRGKYLAKLYFAETYERITGAGQRVFSFTVQGQEFKDFDIWKKAGGLRRAYVESVPVEVTEGEFRIVFTAQVESPAKSEHAVFEEPGNAGRVSHRRSYSTVRHLSSMADPRRQKALHGRNVPVRQFQCLA
jgi:malectin (di-glucose binding ER protein)